jgi:hypothetical protein
MEKPSLTECNQSRVLSPLRLLTMKLTAGIVLISNLNIRSNIENILFLPLALQLFVGFGFLRQVIQNFSIRC